MLRAMTFEGWQTGALTFYQGLEADNSKAYWAEHKAVYESEVREPLAELLEEIEDEFGPGRIYRPLRDTRFSHDKTPYKTAACATLDLGGVIQISARGLAVGNGFQTMAADQLERYRASVLDDKKGERLIEVIAEVAADGVEVEDGQQLKGAPRGLPKDHPRIELLRKKDMYTWRDLPVAPWLRTSEAKTPIVEYLRASRPLHAWLVEHVGPTSAHRPRYGT